MTEYKEKAGHKACAFYCISTCVYDTINHDEVIRLLIANHVVKNWDEYKDNLRFVAVATRKSILLVLSEHTNAICENHLLMGQAQNLRWPAIYSSVT